MYQEEAEYYHQMDMQAQYEAEMQAQAQAEAEYEAEMWKIKVEQINNLHELIRQKQEEIELIKEEIKRLENLTN